MPNLALHRYRHLQPALLWLLLVLLPLQATAALIGALSGSRHVHLAEAAAARAAPWLEALRVRLAPQGPLLFAPTHRPAAVPVDHVHDGTPHRHGTGEAGVLTLADTADDGGSNAGAVGLALLPTVWHWGAAARQDFGRPALRAWSSHAAAPPRRPPRAG